MISEQIARNKKGWFLGACAIAFGMYLVFSFAFQAFADPPGSPYIPGETLNPNCAPTSTNCTVSPPLFTTSTALPQNGVLFVSDNSGTITANPAQLSFTSSTGYLGIGTTSPLSEFSVAGLSPQTTTSSLVLLGSNFISGGNPSGTLLAANVPASYNGDFLNFQIGNTPIVDITSGTVNVDSGTFFVNTVTNQVGIGTTSPLSELSVANLPIQTTSSSLVLLGTSFIDGGNPSGTFLGVNVTTSFNGDFLNFQVNSTSLLDITSGTLIFDGGTFFANSVNNFVGIGTTRPSSTLQVVGTITATTVSSTGITFLSATTTGNLLAGNVSTTGLTFLSATSSGSLSVGSISSTNEQPSGYLYLPGGPIFSTSTALLSLGSSTQNLANGSGTYIGINTTSSFGGYFLAFQDNSTTKFSIASSGFVIASTVSSTGLTFLNGTSTGNLLISTVSSTGLTFLNATTTGNLLAGTVSSTGITFLNATSSGNLLTKTVSTTGLTFLTATSSGSLIVGSLSSTNYTGSGYINLPGAPIFSTTSSLIELGSSTQNLPNGSGTYIGINTTSSFGGDFADFQVNSSTKFRISSSGRMAFATGTFFGATTTLTVCAQNNCVEPATASATNAVAYFASANGNTTDVSIVARGAVVSGETDVGEYINVVGAESDYGQGDLLSISQVASDTFQKSSTSYDPDLAGIITTTAGLIAGGGEDVHGSNVIALAGRVPVKVTGENGPIAIGDYITSSDVVGYGMKATQPGEVVGIAMAPFDGTTVNDTGTVLVFVDPHYDLGNQTVLQEVTQYVQQALNNLGVVIVDGVATLKGIVVDKVTTNVLCIQNVCITSGQLGSLLQNAGITGGSNTSPAVGASDGTNTDVTNASSTIASPPADSSTTDSSTDSAASSTDDPAASSTPVVTPPPPPSGSSASSSDADTAPATPPASTTDPGTDASSTSGGGS